MNSLNQVFEWLGSIHDQGMALGAFAAFVWGMLSILLSPCHLASIPLIIGYMNKKTVLKTGKAFMSSLLFSLGILVTIALIGLITSALGRLLGDIGTAGNYIVAAIFFLAGLYLLDVLNPEWSGIAMKPLRESGGIMTFVLGLMFGLALGPCTFAFMAPVLGASFRYAESNMLYSVMIILAFGAGHCLVISGVAATGSGIMAYLQWTQESRGFRIAKKVCGVLVLLGGVYFIYQTLL